MINSIRAVVAGALLGAFFIAPVQAQSSSSCTLASSAGFVGDGVTANDTALANWVSGLSSSGGCLSFGPGKFLFNTANAITIPNSAGWTATSTTSNTIGRGSKTFTVANGLSIPAGSSATAYNTSSSGIASMSGTVTSYSGTTLVLNITGSSGSGTFSGWDIVQNFQNTSAIASVTIAGAGADITRLYFPNTAGLTFAYSSQQHSVHLRDFAITTGGANNGAAVTLRNSYPFFGTFVAQSDVLNVTCRGDDGYAHNAYWTSCFQITNVSDVNFDNVNAYGNSNAAGAGIVFSNPGAGCFASPITCGTIYNISNSNFSFLATGVQYGAHTQTVSIANTQFLQTSSGIYIPASGGSLQGLSVSNSTCFTLQYCIVGLSAVPNLVATGNFINVAPGYYGVSLMQEDSTFVGNQFLPRDAPNSGAGGISIAAGNASSVSVISGNTFSSVGQAVFLKAGTAGINVQSNAYTGNTGNVLNLGSNTIGGGSQ